MQDGLTALDLASVEGHPEVYQELVTHGKHYTLFFVYQHTRLLLSKVVLDFNHKCSVVPQCLSRWWRMSLNHNHLSGLKTEYPLPSQHVLVVLRLSVFALTIALLLSLLTSFVVSFTLVLLLFKCCTQFTVCTVGYA